MSETVTKKHLHDHPLQWNKQIEAYNCEACKEAGQGPSYHCSSCKTKFHGDCVIAPACLHHPFYPDTDLLHINVTPAIGKQGKSCRACGNKIRRFGYCNPSRGLYFHSCCATLPVSVKELKMVLLKEVGRDSGNCVICNSRFDGAWAYCFEATRGYAHVWCVLYEQGHAVNLVDTMSFNRSEPHKSTPRMRSSYPPVFAHPQGPPKSTDRWAPPPQGPHDAYDNQWAPPQVPLPPPNQGSHWHPGPTSYGNQWPNQYYPPPGQWRPPNGNFSTPHLGPPPCGTNYWASHPGPPSYGNQWPNQQGQWPPLNGNFYFPPQGGPPPCGTNYWASHPGPSSSNQPPSNNSNGSSSWDMVSKWGYRLVMLAVGIAGVAT